MSNMKKSTVVIIMAVIALALIGFASQVSTGTGAGTIAIMFVLMLAYCAGQYVLSRNYR